MGEWKAQISLRVPQAWRIEFENFAKHERRTMSNLGEALIEWAFEELKKAGSINQLLNREVPVPRNPDGNYKRGARTS